ncbi:MAG: PAS domain-containing protein, partial [Bacteroidetes bacterium]|nr:PAS domain-containing protein [Bacteroidota bacterium]
VGKRILEILKSSKSSPWMEERFIKLDGSIIYVETVGTPTTYNGKPSVQVIIHDITEHKHAEEMLRESELRFRSVWEKGTDGMRISNEEGIVELVNDAYCKIVGKLREEIEGKPMSIVYEEAKQTEVLRKHQERFRSRTIPAHLERELVLWNGERIFLELSNTFLENPHQPTLSLSVFRDITERKHAEEELHRKEEHHKAVIENIFKFVPEGVLVLTESLNLLKHNKAFDDIVQKYAPLLGYTEEELAEKITGQLRSKIATGDAEDIRIAKKKQ